MEGQQPAQRKFKLSLTSLIWIALILFLGYRFIAGSGPAVTVIPYSTFKTDVMAGKVSSVTVSDTDITGKITDGTAFTTVRVADPDLMKTLEANKVEITGLAPSNGGVVGFLLTWILPLALMAVLWYWFFGRNKGGANSAMGGIFSFGKSKARVIMGEQTGVTFKDVGGAGEAITDLKEVTEFLKNPVHFQRLGGKMPKGVLLVGPPGTGQDPAGQSNGRRGRRAILQPERSRICGDVRRRRRIAGARPVRAGQEKRPFDHFYRRDRCDWRQAGRRRRDWRPRGARANPQPVAGRDGRF